MYLFARDTLEGDTTSGPRFDELATVNGDSGRDGANIGGQGIAGAADDGLDGSGGSLEVGLGAQGELGLADDAIAVGLLEDKVVARLLDLGGDQALGGGAHLVADAASGEEGVATLKCAFVPLSSKGHFRLSRL